MPEAAVASTNTTDSAAVSRAIPRTPAPTAFQIPNSKFLLGMFMNGLALVVVLGCLQAIRTGDRLRLFVGLEARIQRPLALRVLGIASALVSEHQIVMGVEVLRIDGQRALERRDGIVEPALEEVHPADLVEYDAI